jgi:hypothetical protein
VPMAVLYWYGSRLWKYRREHGMCVQCGLELQGATDNCPRCGRPIR